MLLRLYHRNKVYLIECPDGSTVRQLNNSVMDSLLMMPGWKWGCEANGIILMARHGDFGLRLLEVKPVTLPKS